MTHPGGSDRSDLSSWWVDLLAGELGDCASVDRAGGPAEGIVVVTLTPFRAEALAMRIVVGDGSVPEIEFGTARPFVCAGVPTEDGVGGLDPSNQLGVMVAAVITDGAALVRTRFPRRTLVLGHGDRDEEVADARVLHRWPPYADDYVMSTVFRRPPEYMTLPRRAFILPGVVVRP